MTATATQFLAIPGGIVADVDLWFPGRQDPIGFPSGPHVDHPVRYDGADRVRYVVWVPTGRCEELAPRKALHVTQVGRWAP